MVIETKPNRSRAKAHAAQTLDTVQYGHIQEAADKPIAIVQTKGKNSAVQPAYCSQQRPVTAQQVQAEEQVEQTLPAVESQSLSDPAARQRCLEQHHEADGHVSNLDSRS